MASLGITLAGVAHELNNPLAAIIGFAQLLLTKEWPEEDRAALETISHEAIRSATIVKHLLALARNREGERRLRTNINDVAVYIMRMRRYALETAGIHCELRLDPALPAVLGDRAQLEQVVLNLLNSSEQALRAAVDRSAAAPAASARIVLSTSFDGSHVVLEIQDNGPGIPGAFRAHIWESFWTTRGEADGVGLGLAVVQQIVSDHGGTISLSDDSDRRHGGAHFIVRLPVAPVEEEPDRGGLALRPLDVLVVDRAASDVGFIERFLASRGHVVLSAATARRAMDLAERGEFDVVICDAAMRIGAKPLAAALHGTRGCARARMILSAANGVGLGSSAAGRLCDAIVVARPYDVEELRLLIEDG